MRHVLRFAGPTVGLWLAGCLAVCSAQILNSERIEQVFGSYGIDVLYSDRLLRLSSLFSEHQGDKITRTFAIVGYPSEPAPALAEAHRTILAGGSIGATFRDSGCDVIKRNLSIGTSGAEPLIASLMQIEPDSLVATHIYSLEIERAGERYAYATIIEMHHPGYLTEGELRSIYSASGPADPEPAGIGLVLLNEGIATLSLLPGAP